MSIKASLNYLRMSPRKVRVVANAIKNLPVLKAEKQLMLMNKKAAQEILKLLKSALTNALNQGYQPDSLFIKNIIVSEGPRYKKLYPKARGRVGLILKKTSHIEMILEKLESKVIHKK